MINRNVRQEQFSSLYMGLRNTGATKIYSVSVPSQTLAGNAIYTTSGTFTVAPVDNAVMYTSARHTGLETFWRVFNGNSYVEFGNYSVEVAIFITGKQLTILVAVFNLSGSSTSVPAITLDTKVAFYLPPF